MEPIWQSVSNRRQKQKKKQPQRPNNEPVTQRVEHIDFPIVEIPQRPWHISDEDVLEYNPMLESPSATTQGRSLQDYRLIGRQPSIAAKAADIYYAPHSLKMLAKYPTRPNQSLNIQDTKTVVAGKALKVLEGVCTDLDFGDKEDMYELSQEWGLKLKPDSSEFILRRALTNHVYRELHKLATALELPVKKTDTRDKLCQLIGEYARTEIELPLAPIDYDAEEALHMFVHALDQPPLTPYDSDYESEDEYLDDDYDDQRYEDYSDEGRDETYEEWREAMRGY